METSRIERLRLFLNRHPVIGIPVRLIMTIVFGAGYLLIASEWLAARVVFIVGKLLILLALVAFVFWVMGSGANIGDILIVYFMGASGLLLWELYRWRTRKTRPRKKRVATHQKG